MFDRMQSRRSGTWGNPNKRMAIADNPRLEKHGFQMRTLLWSRASAIGR